MSRAIDRLVEEVLGRPHRHRGAPARRSIVRSVTGDIDLVIEACRCGASRTALVRHVSPARRALGALVQAGPWGER